MQLIKVPVCAFLKKKKRHCTLSGISLRSDKTEMQSANEETIDVAHFQSLVVKML